MFPLRLLRIPFAPFAVKGFVGCAPSKDNRKAGAKSEKKPGRTHSGAASRAPGGF